MPSENAPQDGASSVALQPDPGAVIPRLSLGETGFLGLKTRNGFIWEETNRAFRYPAFIKTVNEMRNNTTVGAAMNVYRMMISRVKWDVEPPVGATEVEKERAKLVRTMMDDMEHSWASFIESIIPYLEYGFQVNEKVFRRRLKRNGSKFNDGLIGIRKLPTRSQDTISRWIFSEDGADLLHVEQTLTYLEHAARFQSRTNERGLIEIPREKFLLFSASANKGNPEGNSIYKNIFLAFKRLELLIDQELLAVAKDVQGILCIQIPPQYLDPNASTEYKATAAAFQNIIDNYNAGTQRGLLVPLIIDPESKQPMFKYELMADKGQPKIDTEAVIKRFQADILSALNVDILKLGSDGTGSFSLASAKSSVLALAIDYRLREIQEVLNSDLMRTIFELNGWSTENLPKFVYEDIEEIDLQDFSSAIQRIFATSAIEVDREVMNRIRKAIGVKEKPDDEPIAKDMLPASLTGQTSRSGDGMEVGTSGSGTAKNGVNGGGDSSIANKENK